MSETLLPVRSEQCLSFEVVHCEDYGRCQEILANIGTTVEKTRIEVRDSGVLLNSSKSMSLHTDHPAVDVIAWYCASQADSGGESVLLDFEQMRNHLTSEQLCALQHVNILVPRVSSLPQPSSIPMLSSAGLYFADWLIDRDISAESRAALTAFRNAMLASEPVRVRLKKGQALIINNKRLLHGRTTFTQSGCRRLLIRHWIRYRV